MAWTTSTVSVGGGTKKDDYDWLLGNLLVLASGTITLYGQKTHAMGLSGAGFHTGTVARSSLYSAILQRLAPSTWIAARGTLKSGSVTLMVNRISRQANLLYLYGTATTGTLGFSLLFANSGTVSASLSY
jgi:hypothetical protein